jgi:hypothetical protein
MLSRVNWASPITYYLQHFSFQIPTSYISPEELKKAAQKV